MKVRPYTADDVDEALVVGHTALYEAGPRYGWETSPLDDGSRARARLRHAHLVTTDPDGAHVAEDDDGIIGVALSLRRGPLWFLSLLAVAPQAQGRGVGQALLDATLRTAGDAGLIMSSADPKALRRYGAAGFALHPGYDASGPVDRGALPVVQGVREGDWQRDGERLDAAVQRRRGAPYGPDLEVLAGSGARLLVAGDGAAVFRTTGQVVTVAADSDRAAADLLWAVLAEVEGPVHLDAVTDQQWAVEVALAARLSLRPGSSLCTRGAVGPLTPYLASGAYG